MTDSDRIYFANKALSKSAIDKLLECPALYKAWLDGEEEEKDSAALRFGSLCHLLTLQPEEFGHEYAVCDLSMATKEGKAFKAALPDGVQIIKGDEYEKAQLMADAVRDHPQARMLFGGEGYTTLTIATPTGEGLTSAKSFTRARRCVLKGDFRII